MTPQSRVTILRTPSSRGSSILDEDSEDYSTCNSSS